VRVAAAVITCLAMAAVWAGVGLLGEKAGPAHGKPVEVGAAEAAFASTQAPRTEALSNEGTKAAVVEASNEKAAGAEEARMAAGAEAPRESSRGAAVGGESPATSEQHKKDALGSAAGEKPAISSPQPAGTPRRGAASHRKTGGDDFNFGF
jgi:hypothetical protein